MLTGVILIMFLDLMDKIIRRPRNNHKYLVLCYSVDDTDKICFFRKVVFVMKTVTFIGKKFFFNGY